MAALEPWSAADAASFRRLCSLFCTEAEICGLMGIEPADLDAKVEATYGEGQTFATISAIFAAEGKRNLRAAQVQSALNGNTTMQIWLGKQYLGQADAPQQVEVSQSRRPAEVTPFELIQGRHAERRKAAAIARRA